MRGVVYQPDVTGREKQTSVLLAVVRWLLRIILTMSDQYLKWLARLCKTLAVFISVVLGLLIFPPRWNVSAVADAWVVCMAVLALVPNRWLVSSRISFVIVLLPTLVPFRGFFEISNYRDFDLPSVIAIFIDFSFLAPLPLSFALSRIRLQRGDKFTYA